jgi:hypothetical protein
MKMDKYTNKDMPRELTPEEYIKHQHEVIADLTDCYEGCELLQDMWRNRYANLLDRTQKLDSLADLCRKRIQIVNDWNSQGEVPRSEYDGVAAAVKGIDKQMEAILAELDGRDTDGLQER